MNYTKQILKSSNDISDLIELMKSWNGTEIQAKVISDAIKETYQELINAYAVLEFIRLDRQIEILEKMERGE